MIDLSDNVFSKERPIVCVQGLGFVGSAMATAVATAKDESGDVIYNVIGIERASSEGERIVQCINKGIFPFESNDKYMATSLKEAAKRKNIWACTDSEYFQLAKVIIVDINLDVLYDKHGEPYLNLDSFKKAMHTIGSYMGEEALLLIETTVPPGTCEKVVYPIISEEFEKRGVNKKPQIAHSYERVMPGENYLASIVSFWRVYSGIDDESADKCQIFLETVISTKKYPLKRLKNTNSTEIGKVLENSYRATTIAFMEEWGRFAEAIDVDLFEVIDAIKMRPTHSNMMRPGFGVGGYCLTKDPWFGKLAAKDLFGLDNLKFPFCSMSVHYNHIMPIVSLDYIETITSGIVGKKILMLGVSYRQDVADTRYSPSEIFAKAAMKRGAILEYEDPLVKKWVEMDVCVRNEIPAFVDFDVVLFTVQHMQYKDIDFCKVEFKAGALVFDANRVLNDEQIRDISKRSDVKFFSIGRGYAV